MKRISINDFPGITIGQVENAIAGTGCTVFICREGMRAGVDVRGGGPASRETELLNPLASAQEIHAVILSGGSAFGLNAAGGVMRYLEENDIGFDVGVTKVPLVVQSCLFDLTAADKSIRPDSAMGYEAARLALEAPNYRDGNYGAGTGATVGKFAGMSACMKSGIGSYAVSLGDLKLGAVVAVNALGDVFNWRTGEKLAGLLTGDTIELMKENYAPVNNKFTGNTTLAVVMTNAYFTKSQLCKISGMAQDGLARSIRPIHTSADGDTVYALSSGTISADMDLVGTLAAEVVSEAIINAVTSCEGAYGFKSYRDIKGA